jgi:hypothetical protein
VPSWKQKILRAAPAAIAAVLIAGCSTTPKAHPSAITGAPSVTAAEKAGVEVVSLRRTAEGRMLDFRFRVLDPEKASPVLLRSTPAYLVDEATGATLEITETRMGKMRQNTWKPEKGRVYWMLFQTAGRRLAPGDKATVVI